MSRLVRAGSPFHMIASSSPKRSSGLCAGASFNYRFFCWGVVLTSVWWLGILSLYTMHLSHDQQARLESLERHRRETLERLALRDKSADDKWDERRQLQGGGAKADWDSALSAAKSRKADESLRRMGVEQNSFDKENPLDREDAVFHHGQDKHDTDREGRRPMTTEDQSETVALHVERQKEMQVPLPPKPRLLDLDELGLVRNEADQEKKRLGSLKFSFNILISDRIGERRAIPDSRHKLCQAQVYASALPAASIIVCHYNEAPSALIRMVNSILDRTPASLLHELLLVDDNSQPKYLEGLADQQSVSDYARLHWDPKVVKLIRTEKREGLIRAKIFASHKATGQVLVFLDSHCEVNEKWLEPLLSRIAEDRTRVVCPIIDIIDSDNFKYVQSPVCYGGFNWGLFFKWDYPKAEYLSTDRDYIKPLRSPTMAGGLFAIDKAYFKELGEYDPGMDIWGAENVEISFRIWQCGGSLEIIPCSRVGHVFRKRRPYGDNGGTDTSAKNSARVAEVWLDEFKEKFYEQRSVARRVDYGDISERLALRKRLNCKSFRLVYFSL